MELLEDILKGDKAAGVEFIFRQGGGIDIHFILLKKEKRKITVEKALAAEYMEGLKSFLSPEVPVSLSFNGKGIIHKKVSSAGDGNEKSLLNKVLPNADVNDFYMQQTPAVDGECFISVVRKETVDTVVNEIREAGVHVVACSFGPFGIGGILPLMNHSASGYDLKFSGNILSIANGRIDTYRLADTNGAGETVQVGTDLIQGNKLVAFSSALNYFTGEGPDTGIPLVKDAWEDYRQKKIFKTALAAVLAFLLIALMANYLLYTHYSQSYNELNGKVEQNTVLLSGFEELKKEIGEKQAFLEQTGLLDASRTSFYADRMAMDIPSSIQLSEMNINPLVRKNAADDADLNFTTRTMKVSGSCDRSSELNEWIKKIRQKDWVKQVAVLNYSQDRLEKEGEFMLEVTMK